jgi:SAM-dependent methyltransferase
MRPPESAAPPDGARVETHPDHLATIATLLGGAPAPPATCRVLELGCGSGGNLLPMAIALPGARLVGLDAALAAIAEARRIAAALRLGNVEFTHGRLEEIEAVAASSGPFDYILVPEAFTTANEAQRAAVLGACARLLAPTGVAFIGHATEPGTARVVGDLLRYAAREVGDPEPRIRRAEQALRRLLEAVPEAANGYGRHIHDEAARLRARGLDALRREALGPPAAPLYFFDFLKLAGDHGLRYLADARVGTWASAQLADEQRRLDGFSNDPLEREQYLDFLRNRRHRRSLLVRSDAAPTSAAPSLAGIERLRASALAMPAASIPETELAATTRTTFLPTTGGPPWTINEPPLKAVLLVLAEVWPRSLPIPTLVSLAHARLARSSTLPVAPPSSSESWGGLVFGTFAAGLLDLHLWEPPLADHPGERPKASPLARFQAERGEPVVNLWHRVVSLEPMDRLILGWLDGHADRPMLANRLRQLADSGWLMIDAQGTGAGSVSIEDDLLEPALRRLALSALLVG